jgi:hypothetical protein
VQSLEHPLEAGLALVLGERRVVRLDRDPVALASAAFFSASSAVFLALASASAFFLASLSAFFFASSSSGSVAAAGSSAAGAACPDTTVSGMVYAVPLAVVPLTTMGCAGVAGTLAAPLLVADA